MFKISSIVTVFVLAAALSACVSGPAVSTGAPANQGSAVRGNVPAEPDWVRSAETAYDRAIYVAAVGYGPDRAVAEKNALTNLTALFGQSIQGDQIVSTRYSEAIRNGAVASWTEDSSMTNAIKTSVELESLVGAEIKDYWFDGRSTHYASAVMERQKTARLYADMIRSNDQIIAGLVSMTEREKNSLDGYSRYTLAGTIADANRVFANVLAVVGSAGTEIDPGSVKNGEDYRLEAAKIAGNIPIAVRVRNDKSSRIQGAFAAVLNRAGFRSGGGNTRYVLNVDASFSPVEMANQNNKFVRYIIDANLTDTGTGNILLPYNINGREGHLNLPEAENRAVAAAEKKINENYGTVLSDYLSSLLPAKK
jgi:hypothetical protein